MGYKTFVLGKTFVLLAATEARYVRCNSTQSARDLLQLHNAERAANWWDLAHDEPRAFEFTTRLKARPEIAPAIRLLTDLVTLT